MARKPKIDPCKFKGMYYGARGLGRSSRNRDPVTGLRERYTGCECAQGFNGHCPMAQAQVSRFYAVKKRADPESRVSGPKLREIPNPSHSAVDEKLLVVVPCDETYLKQDSEGTKLHKKHLGKSTDFKGCYWIEKSLIEERLIIVRPREDLGFAFDIAARGEIEGDISDFSEPEWEQYAAEFAQVRAAMSGKGQIRPLEESFVGFDRIADGFSGSQETRAKYLSPAEQETQLEFSDPTAPELVLLAKQGGEEPLSRAETAFQNWLGTLTLHQRRAIEAVYTRNPYGLTQAQVAKQLRIKVTSLRDRLAGALKKLEAAFPHLKRMSRMKLLVSEGAGVDDEDAFEDLGEFEPLDDDAELQTPMPVRRWQPGSRKNPVIHDFRDPSHRPFGPLKSRDDVDAAFIKAQIERECRSRHAFECSWVNHPPRERDRKTDKPEKHLVKQIDRWRLWSGFLAQGIQDMRSFEMAMAHLKRKQSLAERGLAPPEESETRAAQGRIYLVPKSPKKRRKKAGRSDSSSS